MENDPIALNRTAYDRIARRFAQVNAAMPPELAADAQRLLAQLKPGARILDLGCGAGRDLSWMEAHGANAVGADLSRGMLNQSRAVTRSPLVQMDMRFVGFASGSFSAIWCMAALLHLPKVKAPAALDEMARLLAPGGLLFLSVQAGQGEVRERDPYEGTSERFFARYQPDEMAGMLGSAGFLVLNHGERFVKRHWLWFDAEIAPA